VNISENINNLTSVGFLLDIDFINSTRSYHAPLLDQVKYYLNQFDEDGIKLTAKGNLPTKIVKEFIENMDSKSIAPTGVRYTENTFRSIQRARLVTEVEKLVSKKNNSIFLTKKGRDFLKMSDAYQFIFLLELYTSRVNMGFFDHYEDKGLIQAFSLNIAHIVFFTNKFLPTDDYADILREHYDMIDELIEKNIPKPPYLKTKREQFYNIINFRIFEQFLDLFALVNKEDDKYKASDFFHHIMLKPVENQSSTSDIINGNRIKEVKNRFKEIKYDVDLFSEFFLISGVLAAKGEIDFQGFSHVAFEKYQVKEEDKSEFLIIYSDYYVMISNLYSYLLDEKRAHESENILIEKILALVSALFHQLPLTLLSMPLVQHTGILLAGLAIVFNSYGIDMEKDDFLQNVEKKMGSFVLDKVQGFLSMLMQCTEDVKKTKRVSKELTHNLKLVLMSFIVVCWDVMIRHEEA